MTVILMSHCTTFQVSLINVLRMSHIAAFQMSRFTAFQSVLRVIHSFNAGIYIAPLQAGLLRIAPNLSAAK